MASPSFMRRPYPPMIRGLMLVLAACALSAHADVPPSFGIDDAYDEGTATQKRPFRRGVPSSLSIGFDGQHASTSRPVLEGCAGFAPTLPMVREYLRKARQVSARAYKHDEVWSHCEASGTFAYRDGRSGQWRVQQYGLGVLLIGQKKVYLHCEACGITGLGAVK